MTGEPEKPHNDRLNQSRDRLHHKAAAALFACYDAHVIDTGDLQKARNAEAAGHNRWEEIVMLDINWGDVLNILNNVKPYLIALGVVAVIAIIASIAVRKKDVALRKLVRTEAIFGVLAAIVVVANGIVFGPMYTIINLAMGDGSLTEETLASAEEACEEIAGEGMVLLKNEDNLLPLTDTTNLNVFGWASTNPCYGGTGSGALNENYDKVTLLEGLENAGFNLNTELSDFYTEYEDEHPTISPFIQDWTLPEPPASTYSDEMIANAKDFSDTAVIVISRTGAEHADLPTDAENIDKIWEGSGMFSASYTDNSDEYEDYTEGQSLLELSQSEKDMVDLVTGNFDNVIVVYNGSNTFELGFVNEYEQIKGCVWAAGPGQNGFNALGDLLSGELNPSGRTTDTFVADLTATPSYNNFGRFTYDNMTEYVGDSWGDPTTPTFVNYVEGIYVGYKFYETAADEGFLNYDEAVTYPFGYGLSYTTFTQEMGEMTVEDGTVTFDVTVTNTGDVAGKDVVEVFFNPPYTNGGIEKATANLIQFEKTSELAPGASETVTISFDVEDMASFDSVTEGCYVLESGDYEISINSDSHNIISSQIYTVDETIVYDEDNKRESDEVAAVSQLSDAEGDFEYLSRADGFANYETATAAPSTTLAEEYKEAFLYNGNYDPEDYNDDSDEMPIQGADNGLVLADLRGADYDDERWEELLDELTVDEMVEMIALGGFQTTAADSIEKVQTVDCDGPASINNNFTGVGSIGFPSATMIANTWNKDMAYKFGDGIGQMAEEMNVSGWYAPAMNTHRSAFGGRNFEYYSEDGVLAGYMATNAVQGAAAHGVYSYIKHFALNDQEMNRQSMICTWSSEQATREIYLKPFEMAVKEGGATAVMTSYNYIGVTYAGAKSELIENILKDEWGFEGLVLTDYDGNFNYFDADQIIRAGGSSQLATYDVGSNYLDDTTSATSVIAMRNAVKGILYTVVNSNAYSEENLNAGLAAWEKLIIALDVILAALLVVLEVITIRKYRQRKAA